MLYIKYSYILIALQITCERFNDFIHVAQVVNTIMEHIKKISPGFDQYPYKISACLTYRALQTDVPIRDLLQTLSFWPSHLPEFPNTRPIEAELALAEGQILRLGSYKLNQADMDTLRTGEEISVKVFEYLIFIQNNYF